MADPLITKAQLENRLSRLTVARLYDDNNDGTADASPLNQLLQDASSKLKSTLGPIYDVLLLDPTKCDELIRLCLDIAQAYAAQRFPEYVRTDGFKLMQQVEGELKKLRDGVTNLGIKDPPEPAANQGGYVSSGDPRSPDPKPRFSDNWGDF